MKGILDNKEKIIACLIVACLIWLIKSLHKKHTTTLFFPVVYQELPEDRIIVNDLPKEVNLRIEATGTELFMHKYNYWEKLEFAIYFKKHINENYISKTDLKIMFNEQLDNKNININIIKVESDDIDLAFEKKDYKLIPIVMPLKISPANNFEIVGVEINPKYVKLTGPVSKIADIVEWETDSLLLEDISQKMIAKVALKKPALKTLEFSQQQIEYTITVEEFTERELSVPITVKNIPDTLDVFYKGRATVQFQVSIENFYDIDAAAFSLIADFSTIDILSGEVIPLYLEDTLLEIKNLRITPTQLEYHYRIKKDTSEKYINGIPNFFGQKDTLSKKEYRIPSEVE